MDADDRAARLDAAAAQLPLGTKTDVAEPGLRDSVLAAKQELEQSLGEQERGTIVALSSGNDDDAGVTEQQLAAELEGLVGPQVRVVAVRVGPTPAHGGPDPLAEMASASGGEVLDAATTTPDELMASVLE